MCGKQFGRNAKGSVAIQVGIGLIIMTFGIAAALDMASGVNAQRSLQDLTDAAALSVAAEYTHDDATKSKTVDAFHQTLKDGLSDRRFDREDSEIRVDKGRGEVWVDATIDYAGHFQALLGKKRSIRAVSVASFGDFSRAQPLSLAMVLDVSGSMNGQTSDGRVRLDVLRDASQALFDAFEEVDLDDSAVSVGVWPYARDVEPSDIVTLERGWDDVERRIPNYGTRSGTNPSEALERAASALQSDPDRNQTDREQTILFMSDGEIDDHLSPTQPNYTQRSITACEQAKARGVRIVSVWMNAGAYSPQTMLSCASVDPGEDDVSTAQCEADPAACRAAKTRNFFETDSSADFEAAFQTVLRRRSVSPVRIVR